MATMAIDIEYLSTYLSLPLPSLSSVIDSPTTELVRSVLHAITEKAHAHDELAADKLRVDIELENAVRTSETRIEGLKADLENAQKTVQEVRIKLSGEENARISLENELQILKASTISSTSEVNTLRSRILSLEAANRDTLAVVELKSTTNDELARDLQKQHQKGLELSQQISTLHQEVQNAKSAASSASFREGSIRQELELAKRNNDWLESELKTKSTEAMKYRKEKGASVAELQRKNEELTSNLESTKRTEQALRTRLDEMQKKCEESLSKIQQLQEDAAKTEDGFRQELESSRRLAELQSQQAQMHRNRLLEVEASVEKLKDSAADEVGKCQAEVEAERKDNEKAQHCIAELESEVERLQTFVAQDRHASRPGTPHQGLNGSLFGHPSSPIQFRTPGSVRSRSVITATQAIEELGKVKTELKKEKLKTDSLEAQITQMVEGLEAKKPYIDELELENKRLEMELVEMSKFVDQTGKERESAMKNARQAKSEASTAQAEANILSQQLRDLSSQIKMLLADQAAREHGWDALSATEKAQVESLAKKVFTDDELDELTATDRFISQRLVVFRNISELQQKNQEQLKIIRQLGAQMESEEALAAKHQAAQDHEEVQRLLSKIEDYKDELHNLITRSESYIKERDMFRRMLQHRGQIPHNVDLSSAFGQSITGYQNGLTHISEPGDTTSADLTSAIRNLQAQYDQYREEQTIDRKTLKEQVAKLSQEKSALQAEIAKVNSKLMLITDRFDLLNSNYTMLGNENRELQKRSEILSEAAAKQDLRTQQVAEDLVEAKGLLESMRNENANLKAEKKLWKDIQDRLSQDNEALMNERTRLNTLIANQQTLHNERELSESETRRRLQSQAESLETELSTTKRKLSDEREDNKKAQLRREYDTQQNQSRIDSLVTSLGLAREELVAVKTTRDHLQSRVDQLTIELKSAEEKVKLLLPRPNQRVNNNEDAQNDLIREQDLSIEVSELKRDLDLAISELECAKIQMEQYKSIAQSTEEEMHNLNSTSEQFREEMDRVIAEKDEKIRELEQRANDISAELTNTNNELTNLRNEQGEINRKFDEDKVKLQEEISRLKDEDERHATIAQFHQQDLRAQAEIAAKAQQNYENELVKHAEAAKLLQSVRAELNQLKIESAALKSEAESSRVVLSQSETSWEERREQLEQELKELRDRRDDLNAQNRILHQQLDNVNTQVSSLQKTRTYDKDCEDDSLSSNFCADRNMDGLRELNSFLRREKEIVEVQYDLKVQEAKRLHLQLEYAQSQLDETRLKLDQERRSQADMGRSSIAHKDLMEKLNELNLFRESSTTLRNELRQSQSQLAEKTKRVEDLMEQIQPLEMRIRELEHSKETLEDEMRLLREDRDRWQKRTHDIISKYDRIDPADMEQLKETIEILKTERDALLEEKKPMLEKISNFEVEKNGWQQSRQKLIEQAKERNRINTKDIKERTSERDAAIQEKESILQQLSGLQQVLETAVQEKDAAEQKLSSLIEELDAVKSERDRVLAIASQPLPASSNPVPVQQSDSTDDFQVAQLREELEKITQENQVLQDEIKDLRVRLERANLNPEQDDALAKASDATIEHSSEEGQIEDSVLNNGLKDSDASTISGLSDIERKALEEQVALAEARVKEHEKRARRIEEEMESKLKKRSDTMKTALNKKLAEARQTQKAEIEAEYKLKLEQERQIWIAESKAGLDMEVAQTPHQSTNEKSLQLENSHPEISSTPTIPGPKQFSEKYSFASISDDEARQLCQSNKTIREIIKGNIMSKLAIEIQKLKDEHSKILAEAQHKADINKVQAVSMETKRSALKMNMTESRIRLASGKLQIVEIAAQTTPQRAVAEVWLEVKNYKPPPTVAQVPAPAPAPITPANGTAPPINANASTPSKPVSSLAKSGGPALSTSPAMHTPTGSTRTPPILSGSVLTAPPPHNLPPRVSSIPMMRGGSNTRARGGHQNYQPPRGGSRGRGGTAIGGGPNRGGHGLNVGVPAFNPSGQVGIKRPRDDGTMVGHADSGGKRPREG